VAQKNISSGLVLDDVFALSEELSPLKELYDDHQLGIVHACGSPDQSLSHFEASNTLERGVDDGNTIGSGWLSRHLLASESLSTSPIRAIALSRTMPALLGSAPSAVAIQSMSGFQLSLSPQWQSSYMNGLAALYDEPGSREVDAGRATLQLMSDLKKIRKTLPRRFNEFAYSDDSLGHNLQELVQLVEAEVGLEAAVIEFGGWDTHTHQAPQISRLLTSLGRSISAFVREMRVLSKKVVLITISEFGRRVFENGAEGTDHGRGTAMLVAGSGIRGGRVYGVWPGLLRDQLDPSGNLRVTTDYRDVLAEIVERRLQNPQIAQVFPGYNPRYLDLCR
jgi:uncharacterized protein (DUF1501 family)